MTTTATLHTTLGDIKINLFEDQIQHEFWISSTGRDLPYHLDKETAIKRGDHALPVTARSKWVLLCAYIVECHVNGMTDAELIFTK